MLLSRTVPTVVAAPVAEPVGWAAVAAVPVLAILKRLVQKCESHAIKVQFNQKQFELMYVTNVNNKKAFDV